MWNTLFWIWIISKNLQKLKNVLQKNVPEWFGHLTREPICFWEEFKKNKLKLMISKKDADRSHFGSNIESLL